MFAAAFENAVTLHFHARSEFINMLMAAIASFSPGCLLPAENRSGTFQPGLLPPGITCAHAHVLAGVRQHQACSTYACATTCAYTCAITPTAPDERCATSDRQVHAYPLIPPPAPACAPWMAVTHVSRRSCQARTYGATRRAYPHIGRNRHP